jgi:DNA-binding ferritin-like protein
MRFKHLARPLSRLFGKAPPDAAAPADPIAALDSAPPQTLISTAMGSGDEAQRAAAIRKLDDRASLAALAGIRADASSAVPPGLARTAQQRLAQLVDAGSLDFEELSATHGNVSALLAVAGYCSDPGPLTRALTSIEGPERRAQLVMDGPSSRIRQLAAQSVSDPAELKRLLKLMRGKDKSVYKIIREKCDALNAEERQAAKTLSDAVGACESLERHSHRVHDAIYEPTFRHFHTRWQGLAEEAAPEVRERAARAIERCEMIIVEHRQRIAQQAAEASEYAAREAAREQAMRVAELESERLREAAAREAAEKTALREAEAKERADKSAAEALALREINVLIGRTQGALREGGTGRASGLRRALEDKLAALPLVPPPVARQVQKVDATLNELKDWKEHAAAPKRAALIEEMEALIGSALEPRALADRIHQLQEDWKTVSKGVVSDSDADWQRFHQAAQSAYLPCREYFEAEAQLRQVNLKQRTVILDRLRAFETTQSGEAADFRAVAAVLKEAPQEWRRHFPVERAPGRKLQEEFDAVMGRLHERLAAWHARNAAEKQSLIRKAEQLLVLEDGREAAESTKRLQAQWREVGAAARDQERVLWEEFRRHCDAVFRKREQAHADHTSGLQANKARAAALCDEVDEVAGRSGAALATGASKLAEWRSAFDALGELPRGEERALKARFERALDRVRAAVSRQRASEKEQSLDDLLEAARHIHGYGRAVARAASESERAALRGAAETFIAGISQWPKGAAEALTDAWTSAEAGAGAGAGVHADPETALRMLCIRRELLADLPTPPEDQDLRRDHQMRRLVEHMGQHSEPAADEVETLALEWVRVGGVAPERYQALLERFRHPGPRAR